MSILGNGVNDDIFIPEYTQQAVEDGQDEDITDKSQQNDLPPDNAGQGNEDELDNEALDNEAQADETDTTTGVPPKKFAGKFDSIEELEKGYLNSQSFSTKMAQTVSELRKAAPIIGQGVQPVAPVSQSQTQYPDVMNSMINEVYSRVQNEVVAPLMQQLNTQNEVASRLKFENQIAQMATKEPDFQEVAPVMMEILTQRADLMVHEDFLEIAYTLAQKKVNESKVDTRVQNARKEAYQTRDIKLVQNNGTPYAKGASQSTDTAEDQIRNSMLGLSGGKSIFKH